MTEDKGNIEELLQSNLQGRKVEAPAFVWDNVEKAISEKGKKRGFFWLWGSGVMLVLGVTAYMIFFTNMRLSINETPCYYADVNREGVDYLFDKYVVSETNIEASYSADNEGYRLIADNKNSASYENDSAFDLIVGEKNPKVKDGTDVNNQDAGIQKKVNGAASDKDAISNRSNINGIFGSNFSTENKESSDVSSTKMNEVKHSEEIAINDTSFERDNSLAKDETIEVLINDDSNQVSISSEQNQSTQDESDLGYDNQDAIDSVGLDSKSVDLMQVIDGSDSLAHKENQLDQTEDQKTNVEILEKIPADSVGQDVVSENPNEEILDKSLLKKSKWTIGLMAGYSAFDVALFKEEFRSGVLSNRTFKSSGFDADLHVGYSFTDRFNMGMALNYNQKKTVFDYAVWTDDQGYFEHIIKGNPLPLEEINDVDESCNCYLIEDVEADYKVSTFFLDLHGRYAFIKQDKLTAGASLFIGTDLNTALQLNQPTKLAIENQNTRFSVLKTGLGIDVNYWFGNHLGLTISPKYQFLVHEKNHAFYQQRINEFITHFGVKYRF